MYRCAALALALLCAASSLFARGRFEKEQLSEHTLADSIQYESRLKYWQRRNAAVYNAGRFSLPFAAGKYANAATNIDPETGQSVSGAAFDEPDEGHDLVLFGGGLWVGGIINGDTIVSVGFDGWFNYDELYPDKPDSGGIVRTGNFADDEFVSIYQDTVGSSGIHDPPFPFDVRVTESGYNWADTAYGDFVILTYTIENRGKEFVGDGWVGFYLDPDISDISMSGSGYSDDVSGVLDTVLYDDDPSSRVMIPYTMDNDGDPIDGEWRTESVRSIISIRLLDADFPVERTNFNWWYPNSNSSYDFGPRQLGDEDNPTRLYGNDNLGTPVTDGDKYHMMSFPEVDYHGFEVLLHDSTDGWIPMSIRERAIDFADGYDTRFLYSFGSFDLNPGESVSFTIVLVAAGGFQTDPNGFADLFELENPFPFMETLDFSDLLRNHRRVDSVYESGLLLPRPGPPPGLQVVDYDDGYVTVAWPKIDRPDLAGYFVHVRDSLLDNIWRPVSPRPTADTFLTFPVLYRDHRIEVTVSVVDKTGRRSGFSPSLSLIPAAPHPPVDFSATLENAIPRLQWRAPSDTSLQVYLIYRSKWEQPFALYDSTAAETYYDFEAESGVKYNYRIASKNDLGLESKMSETESVLLMRLNQGVLFYNMNPESSSGSGPYQPVYFDALYDAISGIAPMQRIDFADKQVGMKELSDYSLVIFDLEMRLGKITESWMDSTRLYLENGGKAIIILLTASPQWVSNGPPRSRVFEQGSFFYDVLKLDSCVSNNYRFSAGTFTGDLLGCRSVNRMYPPLKADFDKLESALLTIEGGIPMGGYLYPQAAAEPLYLYQSINPDTASHGKVNAIRYLNGGGASFVLFSFPLTLMQAPQNVQALRQALLDLGVEPYCGDVNSDGHISPADAAYLISYLYRDGAAPQTSVNADINCDGAFDLTDIVVLLDFIFGKSARLACCAG